MRWRRSVLVLRRRMSRRISRCRSFVFGGGRVSGARRRGGAVADLGIIVIHFLGHDVHPRLRLGTEFMPINRGVGTAVRAGVTGTGRQIVDGDRVNLSVRCGGDMVHGYAVVHHHVATVNCVIVDDRRLMENPIAFGGRIADMPEVVRNKIMHTNKSEHAHTQAEIKTSGHRHAIETETAVHKYRTARQRRPAASYRRSCAKRPRQAPRPCRETIPSRNADA